jgi:hypothetical protein
LRQHCVPRVRSHHRRQPRRRRPSLPLDLHRRHRPRTLDSNSWRPDLELQALPRQSDSLRLAVG